MTTDTPTETPSERFEVQRTIPAEAHEIFRVLSHPDGHVAIDSSGMLISADGDPVTAVGDRFVVHMDRESLGDYDMGEYDVTVIITRFDDPSMPRRALTLPEVTVSP